MEGYAIGRFEMIVEVQRFLEKSLHYPHIDKKGRVHPTRVKEMLTCQAHAGYVGKKEWNVSLRKGKYEGLITLETFEKIQKSLTETAKVPARKDIHVDFPLRGFILCDDCERPLTSCWSQGKNQKFSYYMCYNKDCESKGKSIPRDSWKVSLKPYFKSYSLPKASFSYWVRCSKMLGTSKRTTQLRLFRPLNRKS